MSPTAAISSLPDINARILTLRDQKVILDSDLARIYGAEVRALLQAVKRNSDRFPEEFVFQLAPEEVALLRSQTVISKAGRGGRRYLPYAFTEHGALMAATVLNSAQAVKMSLFIIRAFVKMRQNLAANAAILNRLAEIDKTLFTHDAALRDIYQKLRPLLEPPPTPPKPEIGFHVKEEAAPYRIKRKPARP
jgi:phage regulator Rha-like protein